MDSSVVATKYPGLFTLSTTDFFYPSVEDPYLQVGWRVAPAHGPRW
jgi:hypothetical protein